jgi:hypothetical protein
MRPFARMLLLASDFAFDQTSNQPDETVSGSLVPDGAPPWQDVTANLRGREARTDNTITRKDSCTWTR